MEPRARRFRFRCSLLFHGDRPWATEGMPSRRTTSCLRRGAGPWGVAPGFHSNRRAYEFYEKMLGCGDCGRDADRKPCWLLGGDGLPREPVSGSVEFDGKPLEKGLITFLPAEAELPATQGGPTSWLESMPFPGTKRLVPGKYRVVITSAGGDSEKSKDTTNGMPGMSAPLPKELLLRAVQHEFDLDR